MTADLRQRMIRSVLRRVLARRCPNTIPRSGREGEKINCFTAFVEKDGEPHLLLDSLDGDLVKCRRWHGDSFSVETEERVSNLVDAELRIWHYYGLYTIEFEGAWSFLWRRCTALDYIWIGVRRAWQAAAQFLFNRRSLRSQHRLRILRILVSRRQSGNMTELTSWDVMTDLYSIRWFDHPTQKSRRSEVEFQLESLVASGDLERQGIGYRATGNSLVTLEQAEAEEQERRHREAFRLQLVIVILTAIIALAAIVQAGLVRLLTGWVFGGD